MQALLSIALIAAPLVQTGETESAVQEIPFELVKGVPLIEVHLGEAGPFTMLVDTGVTPSAVDLAAARRADLELPPAPSGEAAGAGEDQSRPVYATTLTDVRLLRVEYGDTSAVALDLSTVGSALGRPLDGILGHGFLGDKIIELDYPARRMRIHAQRPEPREGLEHWTSPLVLRAGDVMPLVELAVNGTTVRATIDTGASDGLSLFPPGYRRAGLEEAARSGPASSRVGARGLHSVRLGEVDELRLGPFAIAQTEVTFSDRGANDTSREGNFGGAILAEFVLLIDYPGKQLTLSRPAR